jgi:putative ABC transport system permease protein
MGLALLGVCSGALLALALARVLRGLLYQVQPTDALTFAVVAVTLLLVALVASLTPAVRAARLSPLLALKAE